MKYLQRLTLLLFIPMLLASCGSFNDVSISDYTDFRVVSLRGSTATIQATAKVSNPTGKTLKLKKLELDVYKQGYTFATLQLPQPLVVAPRTDEYQTLSLELNIKDPLALLRGGLDINSNEFTVSGYLKAGTSLFSKKKKFDNLTLSQLMVQLQEGW